MRSLFETARTKLTIVGIGGIGFNLLSMGFDLPEVVKQTLMAVGAAMIVGASSVGAAQLLMKRVPRPWLPTRIWRTRPWLLRRPRLSLVTTNVPQVQVDEAAGIMVGCALDLTLFAAPRDCSTKLDFAGSTLVLRQTGADGVHRSFHFRPESTGGFHALPFQTQQCFLVKFVWTGGPQPLGQAPDFHRGYELKVTGVRAEVTDRGSLRGRLPTIKWPRSEPIAALPTSPFAAA